MLTIDDSLVLEKEKAKKYSQGKMTKLMNLVETETTIFFLNNSSQSVEWNLYFINNFHLSWPKATAKHISRQPINKAT